MVGDNLIHQTIFNGILCRQVIVTLCIQSDLLNRLTGILSQDFIQSFTDEEDLIRYDLTSDAWPCAPPDGW